MSEKRTPISPEEFERRMASVIDGCGTDKPLIAVRLSIGLASYVLRQEGYEKGADILEGYFLERVDDKIDSLQSHNNTSE